MRSNERLPFALFAIGALIFMAGACLKSVTARPDVSPEGRPTLEVCAELMAKASPSGTPRAVATVAPSAAPAIPRVE